MIWKLEDEFFVDDLIKDEYDEILFTGEDFFEHSEITVVFLFEGKTVKELVRKVHFSHKYHDLYVNVFNYKIYHMSLEVV